MRTGSLSLRPFRAIARRAFLATCVVAAASWALSAPAWASSPPKYSLKIVEGETTVPEDPVLSTSGSVEPHGSVAVSISRNGVVIARSASEGASNSAYMSQVPEVGDVVSLESPIGTTVGAVVYDGLPSIDPTVCVGSTSFSGQNSSGEIVKGGYYTETQDLPYSPEKSGYGRAQVTILSGTSFGGSFLTPLSIGQTVWAAESLETPLAGEAVFDYSSENIRPVGACPAPPAPAPTPPPPPPALQGSILKLLHITILKLLKHGWHDHVTINQPGTVTQDLYLENGKLPAYASSSGKHHHKTPPALLLARAVTRSDAAGTVTLVLKLTAAGRRKLKSAHSAKVVLVTTLRSTSGAKLSLPRHSLSLRR